MFREIKSDSFPNNLLNEAKVVFDQIFADIEVEEEFWQGCNFLFIHLWGDFDPNTFISKKTGNCSVHSKVDKVKRMKKGTLYHYPFERLQYHVFVHDDLEQIAKKLVEKIDLDKICGFIWFSMMGEGGQIGWHEDYVNTRLHLVLDNDSLSDAIEFKEGSVRVNSGESFAIDPSYEHCVPVQKGRRLHLVMSHKDKIHEFE